MSRNDDLLLTVEEFRLRRQKRRRLLIAGASFVIVVVLLLVLARPASHAIKAWQARRHAEKAFALIAKENWKEAQKEATAAYQLAPNEPEATRAVARFLSRIGQPQALEFWDKLAKQEQLTREDLRDEAGIALALGETSRARAAIDRLMSDDRTATPADWLLLAQREIARGAPNESVKALQRVLQSAAASSREQLQAALLQLRVAVADSEQGEETRAAAWQRIEQLARGQDAAGLDALVLLAQRAITGGTTAVSSATPSDGRAPLPPRVSAFAEMRNADSRQQQTDSAFRNPNSALAIADAIASHPLAQAPQQLLAVDLRIQAAPNEKEQFIQGAIDRWKGADSDSLAVLAKWLNGKGEFERELATIPLERSLQTRDLFLQQVDALGALGRWTKIKELLESERFPLDPTMAHMYLARCNAQLGEKTAAENNWQRALGEADGEVSKLLTLADYAEKNGATIIAGSAYDSAIQTAPKLRAAWQGKLRLAQSARDTRAIHGVLAEMLKIWPNDPANQNDEGYTRLLLASSGKAESSRNAAEGEAGLSNADRPKSAEATRAVTPGGTTAVPSESGHQLSTLNTQLSTLEQLAQRLVRTDPASLPHRTLLALVYLKQKRPATALGVYEKLHVPSNALTPSALAVHAAVLAANGNFFDAAKEAAQVPRGALLPEESALIAGL